MILRKYIPSDCEQLAKLFYQTVHSVNAKDYTKEQLDVRATGNVNLQEWDKSFTEHYTVVAIENNIIVGFGDIDVSGYLDRLFVHREHQREGIASAICDELEQSVSVKTITTHSSITAKPFFEHRGYRVIQKQTVIRNGIALTNFIMEKSASDLSS
jgi:putative acetyltransferase